MTPLRPTFEKRISDSTQRLINEQVEPWIFMRQRLSVKRFDGRLISYEGVDFEGSPRTVFWAGYIEPFLHDLIVKELAAAAAMAKEREVDARLVLPEVRDLLSSACARVFTSMADVDRRLLGHGTPQSAPLKNTDGELANVQTFLDRHVAAEVSLWKTRPFYERWYEKNKFWVWAIGLVVALAGLVVRFF